MLGGSTTAAAARKALLFATTPPRGSGRADALTADRRAIEAPPRENDSTRWITASESPTFAGARVPVGDGGKRALPHMITTGASSSAGQRRLWAPY